MPPVVLVLLAAAAVLHVVWNVLVKASDDPLRVSARAVGWGTLIATPFAAATWWLSGRPTLPAEAALLAAASAVVELGYFNFLSAAYRRGDLSVVYPIARGSAPLLAVVIGLVLLGERLTPVGYVAVALLLGGIWSVWRPVHGAGAAGSRDASAEGPAIGFAFLTGVTIATYSAIDRVGVQTAPPWLYGWILWVFTAIVLQGWIRMPFGIRFARPPDERGDGTLSRTRRAVVVGAAMLGAWLFVLIALSLAPLAVVAPLRESAIVLATIWGVFRLRERRGTPFRLLGAMAIVIGVILVAL